MGSRIVVTGIGAITPAGVGVAALLDALREGRPCIRRIDSFESSDLPCRIAATVGDFDPRDFLNVRQAKRLDRSGQMFVASTHLAANDAELFKGSVDPERIGIFEGTSLGGLQMALQEQEILLKYGYAQLNPLTITKAMTGAGGSMVSVLYGIRGPVFAYCNGSTSSAYALKGAFDQLRLKEIDVAIVGGTEAPVSRSIVSMFSRARILSHRNDDPARACRPFDASRDGVVLGEGAAVLILERLDDAQRREVKIYDEVCSVALTCDACSLISPAENADEQSRAMRKALEGADISADEIDYLSAHGTSTVLNDRTETLAIKKTFGEGAYKIPTSSSKSMLGHALGASTAIEVVKTIVCMEHGLVPPTINLTIPDPECDLDYVPNQSRRAAIRSALVSNSSFGGKNSAIVLKKYRETE